MKANEISSEMFITGSVLSKRALCSYTLLDRNGRPITGRLTEQEERK